MHAAYAHSAATARTFELWREVCCELPEVAELLAQLQLRAVEQDGQDGLCRASIVDDLAGEEDLGRILAAVHWPLVLLVAPLEQEDEAVHWPAGSCRSLNDAEGLSCRFSAWRWGAV